VFTRLNRPPTSERSLTKKSQDLLDRDEDNAKRTVTMTASSKGEREKWLRQQRDPWRRSIWNSIPPHLRGIAPSIGSDSLNIRRNGIACLLARLDKRHGAKEQKINRSRLSGPVCPMWRNIEKKIGERDVRQENAKMLFIFKRRPRIDRSERPPG